MLEHTHKLAQYPTATLTCKYAFCSDKVAFDSLKAANWMLEAAIDYYFASGLSATTPGVDPKAVDQMFSAYKGG
eukprot:scaffold137605_cov17-Tisochrysis_lutea.AAC.3